MFTEEELASFHGVLQTTPEFVEINCGCTIPDMETHLGNLELILMEKLRSTAIAWKTVLKLMCPRLNLHDMLGEPMLITIGRAKFGLTCDNPEERETRKVCRGCPRAQRCEGCEQCVCLGCDMCRFEDCHCQACVEYILNM
ncbi:protein ULTRAPETALA 2 [Sesamum angolense]|uniref:Protein ULTRAPETALA 2 n=1 Tax=Sesamum angolense TaxID=2727404 RepID=A0AAE1WMP3_9LAMI|nr:protein ULTRAPETALA 2 [Sesamum angolense]